MLIFLSQTQYVDLQTFYVEMQTHYICWKFYANILCLDENIFLTYFFLRVVMYVYVETFPRIDHLIYTAAISPVKLPGYSCTIFGHAKDFTTHGHSKMFTR